MRVKPKKRLGQNFLKDKNILNKIVEACCIHPDETILEIGAGTGELTALLAKNAARVIALEIDSDLCGILKERFAQTPNVKVLEQDFLKFKLNNEFKGKQKVVGNIPYYITGHLLRVIGELENKPSKTILLIQKEVAQRICAVPPRSNILSLSVLFWSVPKIALNVPKESFSPPPDVESAVIELKTRENIEIDVADRYYNFIKSAFKQPRKTLLNNLISSGYNHQKAAEIIHQLQLPPMARPQELRFESVLEISKLL